MDGGAACSCGSGTTGVVNSYLVLALSRNGYPGLDWSGHGVVNVVDVEKCTLGGAKSVP